MSEETLTFEQILHAGKELGVEMDKEWRTYQGIRMALSEAEQMAIEGAPGTVYYDEDGEPYLECQEPDEDEDEDESELPLRDEDTGRFIKKE